MNGVSTSAPLPKPMRAHYPDGGAPVDDHETEAGFILTAHEGGIFRLWRVDRHHVSEWSYYPINVVGMTPDEVRRSIEVATTLLNMPHNRQQRRAMA